MAPLGWLMTVLGLVLFAAAFTNMLTAAGFTFANQPVVRSRTGFEQFAQPMRLMIDPSLGASSANARSGPSEGATIVDHIGAGSEISGIGRSVAADGSDWIAYQRKDGNIAYVSERLLSQIDTESAALLAKSCSSRQWPAPILCHDPTIRLLKEQVDDIDGQLRNNLPADAVSDFVTRDRQWRTQRDVCRSMIDESACLGEAYSQRLDELQGLRARVVKTGNPTTG